MGKCKYCYQEIEPRKMGVHVLSCQSNPKYESFLAKRIMTKQQKKVPTLDFKVQCQKCGVPFILTETEEKLKKREHFFCSRSCANSRIRSEETKEKISISLTIEKPKKYCKCCGTEIFSNRIFCSDECKKIIGTSSETRKKISDKVIGKTGGWRNFGGNGKKGAFKGHIFQSSWELAWLIFQIENGQNPIRCEKVFIYKNEKNQIRKYYPDFEMNGIIFEIKGFDSERTQLKISSVKNLGYNIQLVMKKEIQPCLDYCIEKYGEKFYEKYCI